MWTEISLARERVDFLLDLASEFQWMCNLREGLWRASCPTDHDRAKGKNPAHEILFDFDAFHLLKKDFKCSALHDAHLYEHALICDRHFRGVPANHANEDHNHRGNNQDGAQPYVGAIVIAAMVVGNERDAGSQKKQYGKKCVPNQNDPVEPGFVNNIFPGDEVPCGVAHGLCP